LKSINGQLSRGYTTLTIPSTWSHLEYIDLSKNMSLVSVDFALPSLRSLILYACTALTSVKVTGSALKSLCMQQCQQLTEFEMDCPDLRNLWTPRMDPQVLFDTLQRHYPSLRYAYLSRTRFTREQYAALRCLNPACKLSV
jgi:hypothetical protein